MPLRFKTGSVKLISGVQGMRVRKNIAQLIALTDYFDVPIDYLVERSDDPQQQ